MSLDGILLVDKPAGKTSAGVVREVKRRLDVSRVGHLGTLDPFATGLLPLCLGEGSKVVPYLNQETKEYVGRVRLGEETDTLDSTGQVTGTSPVPLFDESRVREVASMLTGRQDQVPPMFSAVKKEGVPLYRLARRGVTVERTPRSVEIFSLRLDVRAPDELEFSVHCSKGTYVRVLGSDIARELGTVGHLSSLRRTAFGRFRIENATALDRLDPAATLPLLTPREALVGARELDIDAALERSLRLGQQYALRGLRPPEPGEEIAKLIGSDGSLVAIAAAEPDGWRLLRVLAPAPPPAASS